MGQREYETVTEATDSQCTREEQQRHVMCLDVALEREQQRPSLSVHDHPVAVLPS